MLRYKLDHGMYGVGSLDLIEIVKFAVVIALCRFLLSFFIRSFLRGRSYPLSKLTESSFYAIYYCFITVLQFTLLYPQRWFKPINWTDTVPLLRFNYTIYEVKLIYLIQIGFYLQGIIAVFRESRNRRDFSMMITHHVSTSVLLLTSLYCSNATEYGTLVLFLHDFSDISLFVAKTLNYLSFNALANVVFVVFAVIFFFCRLIVFPWVIGVLPRGSTNLVLTNGKSSLLHACFWGSPLLILQFLHIKWFLMIVQMVKRKKRDGKLKGDIRSPTISSKTVKSE
ncbi:hypothetical protein P9112_012642 [Eukaryota sp. TZLM1-RC]